MEAGAADSSDELPLEPAADDLPAPRESRPGRKEAAGTVGGKYQLLGELGRGSTGVVHEAQNVWTHRKVALKRLHRFPTPIEEQRFVREARTAARLVHPNIVEVLDMGKD